MESSSRFRRLAAWVDPEIAFRTLFADSPRSFWLDSGVDASAGFSYLGDATDLLVASVADASVTSWAGSDATVTADATIFDALRRSLADAPESAQAGHFAPGWVGWLGYEAGAQTTATPSHPSRYPDAAFLRPARMLIFDHGAGTVTAVEGSDRDSAFGWLSAVDLPTTTSPVSAADSATATWRHDASAYGALIEQAQEEIRDGNAYQLCLTNEVRVPGAFDPVEVYRRLRRASPSHHGGLIRVDGTALVSASPEQFLRITPDGAVTTKPIKGTRPRGSTPEHDDALRTELLASDKERAENLMIVDLMRNDLGRVAAGGSVAVPTLLAVESYAQVHQLVSTVTARLAPGVSAVDAVQSAFPAGSMTGAPKVSAMTILDRLESGPRGVYSGAFGFLGADGAVDLAMVIRSIVIDAGGASVGTGGGITALSVVEDEIEETRVKAAASLAALGVRQEQLG
ncbi:aminodeoxychorismate synthase component I [Mycetocola manganoxydans]|uniref:aminodeoxychorismate synthase n=1 Tax=Mycetocola manganoxydans TaxID=699879 RepID=A0A3L6ZVA5_9MICO|nr:aminodeoxychorismate synthase component I [Mycetocola manganoxydans]RLP71800.1 aminodeoxychorismate synthase component I [Mycetocola manganoxydans]GHD39210.1 hypothetical protein GCM10008097_01650 [Mycetocola manganoxydans]